MPDKSKHILIGLLGTIGAGKTTVSDYLVKKGFYRVIMGDLVRDVARKSGMELTRENLQELGAGYIKPYTKKYWADEAIRRLEESKKEKLLIDGIRKPIDAWNAKKKGAIFILIDAKPQIRYERILKRKREEEKKKTFEKFKKDEAKEWKYFNFKKTLKYVNYKLKNSGSLKELYSKIDKLLDKITKK